jgi:hypothetical protein
VSTSVIFPSPSTAQNFEVDGAVSEEQALLLGDGTEMNITGSYDGRIPFAALDR